MDLSENFQPSPPAPSTARTNVSTKVARPRPSRSSSSSLLLSRSPPPPPPSQTSSTPTLDRFQQSPNLDQRTIYSKPEITRPPFSSNRSSSSTGGGGRVRVGMPYEAEEFDPPVDYYFEGDSGSSTNGSVGGYFADLQLEGGVAQPPPLRFTPPTHHLPPPSPSFHSSSNLPLPSPLTFQYAPSFNPHRHDSGWNSVNPFASAAEGEARDEDDGRNLSSSTSAAGFSLVVSTEEGRTPQACQACRSRKSKCDGNAPCIRCETRGVSCIYVARSPRTRGSSSKRGGIVREPTASSLSSCFTTVPLVHPPTSSPAVGYPKMERGGGRRRSSDGEWGVVVGPRGFARRDTESRSSPVGGEGSRRGSKRKDSAGLGSPLAEAAGGGSEESRRRRPSTDPYPSPRLPTPIASSHHAPPPSFSHSQSYPAPVAYSSFHSYDTQTYQPPPHQQSLHSHSISQNQPHLSHHYSPPLSEHQTHSLSTRYSPFALPIPLHQYGSTPPLDHHSLLLDQPSDASSSSFAVGIPAPTFHHHYTEPYQPQRIHPESRRTSFPSVQAPSSGSHLGFFPRVVEEAEGLASSVAAREPGAASPGVGGGWEEGKWEELSYRG